MRTLVKSWLGRILGKSGPPVIVVFLSGEEARVLAMAGQMRQLVPDHPHVIVAPSGTDASDYAYAQEVITCDPKRPFVSWWQLRRRLRKRWIALAPFVWHGGNALRWMPWLLAPHRMLAFNTQLERHHLRLTSPIASWRFLRGEAVGDIFRPTAFSFLKKIPKLIGFPLLLVCWTAVRIRSRLGRPLAGAESELDREVLSSHSDRVLIGRADLAPQLEAALEEAGVWLAYAGRKFSMADGVPVEAEAKIGERGTWALAHNPAAVACRRDVYVELGGAARLERMFPGAALLALSLLGWQRGYRTVFAAQEDTPAKLEIAPERLVLGIVSDFRLAVRILWRWSGKIQRWHGALAADRVRGVDTRVSRRHARVRALQVLGLLDPAVHVFTGRKPAHQRRVAVVSPYLPFPLSHGGAIRIFNLLRAAAEETDIYLFAFAEQETGQECQPLLQFCSKVILVETPRWEPPSLVRVAPRGVGKFRVNAMCAAIAAVVRDEQIPMVQIEYTQLAHLRSAAESEPVKTLLVEHDITFDLHRQIRQRAKGLARLGARIEEARWRRYELRHARRFDRVIAMSEQDRERLAAEGLPAGRVAVVENGVDLERFEAAPPAHGSSPELLFIGSFRHFPNIEAFRFLTERVWPMLRAWRPELKLTVVAGPDHRYYWRRHMGTDLPAHSLEIEILDFVEDVRPLYRRATVVVVPLVVSAGTNIKVLEALAMQRAVVSTTVGAAGLGLTSGQNVVLADAPDAFASAVLGLLSNDQVREEIAARGRAFVEEYYDWRKLAEKLLALWDNTSPH